jgi:hypothetical protein
MTPTTATHEITETLAASPNQKYWDIGLKCFNDGEVATTAIQRIWAAMAPPASLNVLASIVGSLYADTYWATTKMDRNKLALDLQASLGINPNDCQKAATFAFSKWYGLMVRANFSDAGAIPKLGSLTASPDVIANGKAALTVQQLIAMWNVYVWDPQPNLKNNCYGRAQSINIQEPIAKPILRMYYSDAGFNPPPTSWIQMFTFTGSSPVSDMQGTTPGPVPVGGRIANVDSFAFTPAGSGHYCMIAAVGTEFFTNNPLDTPGNWNSMEWLTNNGAAGWHNVDVPLGKDSLLKFYNQDSTPEHFAFEAHSAKVPAGTIISLGFADKQLAQTQPTQSVKIVKGYEVVGTEAEIPPHYTGDLRLSIDGKPLPADASVDVRLYWRIPPGHRNYLQAVDHLGDIRALNQRTEVHVPLGNFTFIGK